MEHRGRAAWPGLLTLSVLLSPLTAAGQELPAGDLPASEEPETAVEEPPPEITRAVPWSTGHLWRTTSLTVPVSRIVRDDTGALVVLGEDGAIYRQEGADRWRQVLGGRLAEAEIDEEAVLLDTEAAVEDFTNTTVDESTETNDHGVESDPTIEVSGSLEDAVETGIQDADMRVSGLPEARALWASDERPGLLLASRPGGSWRSTDSGRTWTPIRALPPSRDFLEITGRRELILAATDSGVWFSVDDGRSWLEGSSAMRGVGVMSLATDGALVFAGTTEGLWISMDGARWAKLLPPRYADLRMDAVLTDPAWVGGLWVATTEGLLRSDDAGQTFRPAGRNPLIGTTALTRLPGAGQLLAAGDDGVWETVDSGVRWSALAAGLPGPLVADVVGGVQPAIATRTGVYILSRPVQEAGTDAAEPIPDTTLTAEDVVGLTLRRTGMNVSPLEVQRKFARSVFTPMLRLSAQRDRDVYVHADYDAFETTYYESPDWRIAAEACFGGCATSSTSLSYDSYSDPLDFDLTSADVDLFVIEGESYVATDDSSSIAPAAVNVSQRITRYRTELTDSVVELYYARQRLIAERSAVSGLPLMEQVLHDLQIQEVNARLDVYTDGRFTASLDSEQ